MIKEDMPFKYSTEVREYITELCQVADSLHKIGKLDQIFQKGLLVFMDEGWGYPEFLDLIAETLAPFYDTFPEDICFKQYPESYDKGVEGWVRNSKGVSAYAGQVKIQKAFGVINCDLREFMDDLSNPNMINALKKMMADGKNILFVFRFPHMSESSVANMQSKFAKLFPTRSLVIPPIPTEQRVLCVKDVIEESGFVLAEDAQEALEEWVLQNKANIDGGGYHALIQMADDLIYQNALSANNVTDEEEMKLIFASDILALQTSSESETDAYELLNELIGMTELKLKIKEIVAQIKLQKEWEKQGKNIGKPSMHMLFYGNPGTGKTTFARILGKIFWQEGLLSKGEFMETTGNFFVEGLVSELMKKARTTCKEARGSVLFVDEAYGMSVGYKGGNTAEDIIPIFVSEMEDYRDDMCVIFAGYEEEMENFLKINSGLKSRIPHVLRFPNYSKDELQEIFFKLTENTFEYEDELKETLQEYLEDISTEAYESKEFSNARFMRNLYERVWGKAAYRISFSEDKEDILKVKDMKAALEEEMFASMLEKKNEKRIGFAIE